MTYFPPQVPRYTHPDYQRTYGHALALTDAAEAIVLRAGDPLHGAGRALGRDRGAVHPRRRRPAVHDDPAGRAASRPGRAGDLRRLVLLGGQARTRLQRYYRDVAMYHGHIASQYLTTAGELARVHFGLPDSLF